MLGILDHRVHDVAGQPAAGVERRDASILDAAQPAFGCCPDRAVGGCDHLADHTLAEPVAGRVRGGYTPGDEMDQASREGADPYSAAQRICRQPPCRHARWKSSLVLPGRVNPAIWRYAYQAAFAVSDPQVTVHVLRKGIDIAARRATDRCVGAILDI